MLYVLMNQMICIYRNFKGWKKCSNPNTVLNGPLEGSTKRSSVGCFLFYYQKKCTFGFTAIDLNEMCLLA